MRAIFWLLFLALAAAGAASIVDYLGLYDVPMIDVVEQAEVVEAFFKR